MKQFLTILIISTMLWLPTLAQDSVMTFQEATIDTIAIDPGKADTVYFNIINLGDTAIDVRADRIGNDLTIGHGSFFCWDLCYDTVRDASLSTVTIEGGDTTTIARYVVLRPNGIDGFSSVTMGFTDMGSGSFIQRTYVFKVGDAVTSVADVALPQVTLHLAPNPATNLVNVRYSLPPSVSEATLQIVDLLGRQLDQVSLSQLQGTAQVNVGQLPRGLYLMRLQAKEETLLTRRLNLN